MVTDSIIAHTVVTLSADDPTMEAMTDRVKALKGYFRKLDLSSIKGDLKHARGGEKGALLALYSRWHRNDGKGMTPDQIVEELRERGVVIDAENPADILLEMDRMYTEALDAIAQNSNILLDQFLSDADLAEYRDHLKQKILEATKDKGSRSKSNEVYGEGIMSGNGASERLTNRCLLFLNFLVIRM